MILLLLCFFRVTYANQVNQSQIEYFTQKVDSIKLYESVEWQKILYYQKKYFTGRRGIVDGDQFYLAKDGAKNLRSEMIATLSGFFTSKNNDEATQCKFPRRLLFLQENLEDENHKIPEQQCEGFHNFLKKYNPQGLSLVFSSNYLNNPSSMFGHTFLRIHNSDYELTDYGVNFAAETYGKNNNPIIYMVKGLSGGYPGVFSLLPYTVKLQEYVNFESRDLWEYDLNINPVQIKKFAYSLFEINVNPINYYYFDENCSYILLALLDTIDNNFNLTDKFNFWVNPSDTVKAITSIKGMVKSIHYRPSSLKKFLSRYSLLDPEKGEDKLFLDAFDGKINTKELVALTEKESTVRILDTILEYIDYKERLAGSDEVKTYPKLREATRFSRADLKIKSGDGNLKPSESQRADLGVPGSRIGITPFYRTEHIGLGGLFEFRPALHDIKSPSLGYSKDAQIELFNLKLGYLKKNHDFFLDSLNLISILSLATLQYPVIPLAWKLRIFSEHDNFCRLDSYSKKCLKTGIETGAGFVVKSKKELLQYYLMLITNADYSISDKFKLGAGVENALIVRPNETSVIYVGGKLLKYYNFKKKKDENNFLYEGNYSFNLNSFLESRLGVKYYAQPKVWEMYASLYYYFY